MTAAGADAAPGAGFRERIGYQPVLLGVVALLASGALALASLLTHDAIAAAEARDLRESLTRVLPEGLADNDILTDVIEIPRGDTSVTVYRARRNGRVSAVVFQVSERGYAAQIQLLMAVDADGRTLGVRIIKHSETPGLGDKIEPAKSDWAQGFAGRSLDDPAPAQWAVKKDGGVFDQFAGATVTPRAVVRAVKGGLDFFAAHREQMLGDGS
ncbi:electron transport complex subunit RsxG [Denitromonas sp. IR12]|uniref:Ion-translocating oxidoreductase complex subunit G n=2 Tax=Denitromonas iodatirespirans TaxID=2795389 RepID=A0A944HBR8_DENI1|nr:electron transport complex subunit RsxG [Denitromonas iodatirespirans]